MLLQRTGAMRKYNSIVVCMKKVLGVWTGRSSPSIPICQNQFQSKALPPSSGKAEVRPLPETWERARLAREGAGEAASALRLPGRQEWGCGCSGDPDATAQVVLEGLRS